VQESISNVRAKTSMLIERAPAWEGR
jgi:hypothetical protein